ncbi:pyridine nucleotide-disulfide oxidoreductase domain-containing protein 2 isoform X1 [Takifugu rubripes]|uniref:Pyridine nucleotide-disulfide oxidoreductase domain-containing protein 2 n=1 Tax=Takifugu rubripes TaxID=31033 RepID=A0A674MZG3_TAKRU|nr:pyridine nucleotide-disulfide oxidoreductase domain-containing protein 2 isoform X1 [Takifugu rubripes]|eukprot:XP_003964167.1 PREDICTED: pyridine nucleotide-disulfide oxidoreductase domain-containing protein 2 isoform X1 [Takifugu rubripes]
MWTSRTKNAAAFGTVTRFMRRHFTIKSQYDALVIGGGHNGLVAAAYLQRGGLKTAVLERRHVLGGAAVTEEIIPGFRFSRCSYVLSLLRPHIYSDLELKKHGLKVYMRDPHAFTPMLEEGLRGAPPRSLTLGSDVAMNQKEISKFSQKDAEVYPDFVAHLDSLAAAIHPLLDAPPVDIPSATTGSLRKRLAAARTAVPLVKCGLALGTKIPGFYEILTAPIMKILNRWFDSEPLKATLATDGVIGAMTSPSNPGSGYVLLHHVMGELEKEKGAWGYVEGGMGRVSEAIASSARSHGADIFTEKDVDQVLVGSDGAAKGVVLKDGTEIRSKVVLSNATPDVTFRKLTPRTVLSPEFIRAVEQIDYTSPVTKINVAVDSLPNFLAAPTANGKPGPHHQCSIHINCESVDVLETAYKEALNGRPSSRPMVEMTVPSVLDPTLAPPGCHVISLFTQFTPYHIEGKEWTDQDREAYADRVFDWVEQYAPGFKSSVIGRDILVPPDLEKIFGLTGGNIFHGSMPLDQLYLARPLPCLSNYRSPVKGLYLCGSGSHPGGGVMGSPGWNAALAVMADLKHQ